jgi:hypothetical protein
MARAREPQANDQAVKKDLVASALPSPLAPYLWTLNDGIACDDLIKKKILIEKNMMAQGKEMLLAILNLF